jgi:hypothetical protein
MVVILDKAEQERNAEREARYERHERSWAMQIACSRYGQRLDCTPASVLRLAAQYVRMDADNLEQWADKNEAEGLI